jgi:hypothetical protein
VSRLRYLLLSRVEGVVGYTLHVVFDNVRVPFTSVGVRYDLNHHKLIGPDNGNGYAAR